VPTTDPHRRKSEAIFGWIWVLSFNLKLIIPRTKISIL
jgi:hypothetical protein